MADKQRGKVKLHSALLLQLLDFKGGKLVDANYDSDCDTVDLVIDHPDMPIMGEGDCVTTVCPVYTQKKGKICRLKQ